MYDDITANDDTTQKDDYTNDHSARRWTLGAHGDEVVDERASIVTRLLDSLAESMDGRMRDVLDSARQEADELSINGFKCSVCGLPHGHPDDKHDIRTHLNVRPAFADAMNYVPYCHCSVHELEMLCRHRNELNRPIFTDEGDAGFNWSARVARVQNAANGARIGDHVHREIAKMEEEAFGSE